MECGVNMKDKLKSIFESLQRNVHDHAERVCMKYVTRFHRNGNKKPKGIYNLYFQIFSKIEFLTRKKHVSFDNKTSIK